MAANLIACYRCSVKSLIYTTLHVCIVCSCGLISQSWQYVAVMLLYKEQA